MNRLLALALLCGSLSFGGTITFTEVPIPCCVPVTNEFAAFGITMQDLYYYEDARDTFDGKGVALNSNTNPGKIFFTAPTDSLSIDYWVINGYRGTYSVYNTSDVLLSTLAIDASLGDQLGTHVFAGPNIARLELGGSLGYTQVSTLRFDDSGQVPEPSTWALMLSGIGVLAVRRFRRS